MYVHHPACCVTVAARIAKAHRVLALLFWRKVLIMALFGTSPSESTPLNSKSLFGDEQSNTASASSLFDDDGAESPWSMPTPKRAARQNLVKSLLPATEVPESYTDAYDAVLNANERTGSGIGLTGIRKVLENSNLSEHEQTTILHLVVTGGQQDNANGVGRSEFNVLLALIGLGQEGEDITLDGVDERRRSKWRRTRHDRTFFTDPFQNCPSPRSHTLISLWPTADLLPTPRATQS